MAILEAKRIMGSGKTMTDVMASFRAMRTGERWTQCPPEVAVMLLFSWYPAKDDREIKKELTSAKVEEIRKNMPIRNPAQAGFSVEQSVKESNPNISV
eukprot:91051-Rhodomonas_salina.2